MNSMQHVLIAISAVLLLVTLPATAQSPAKAGPATAGATKNKLIIQVSDPDPKKWGLALNNAKNVQQDLGRDNVEIEIVAYGPGLAMLKLIRKCSTCPPAIGGALPSCPARTDDHQKVGKDDGCPRSLRECRRGVDHHNSAGIRLSASLSPPRDWNVCRRQQTGVPRWAVFRPFRGDSVRRAVVFTSHPPPQLSM